MATYTFTQKTAPIAPGQLSNFGGMVNDANRNTMLIGAGPQTVDISSTPVVSPIAFPTTVTTLTTPTNATQLTLIALTNTLNVSESDPTVTANYFTVPAGIPIKIDVARTAKLYIKANTGAATGSSFYYNIV